MIRTLLAVTLACALCGARAAPRPVLTADGIGPLRIGMTLHQVEKTIGRKIEQNDMAAGDPHICGEVEIPGRPGIGAMLEYDRITVIYIGKPYRTVDGVYFGTSEAALRRLFGARAVFSPRPYQQGDPRAHNVVVKLGGKREFLFQTRDGKVDAISMGDLPGIEYMEGCA